MLEQYTQCPNCDYICKLSELAHPPEEPRMLVCPSCGEEYYEGDHGWDNPMDRKLADSSMTKEEVLSQIEWQNEIKRKGALLAMTDLFLEPAIPLNDDHFRFEDDEGQ